MQSRFLLALALFLFPACLMAAPAPAEPAPVSAPAPAAKPAGKSDPMAEIQDVPGLPRVLLIGDSISIGYTLPVRELLKGKANVHRIRVNGQNTRTGLAGTTGPKSWLGNGKWDVIHFNFGIWDARIDEKTGLATTSHEEYAKNLMQIAERLQATGAKVIFATTTPIPANLLTKPTPGALPPKTRLFEEVAPRNEVAVAALKKMGVAIDDLHAVILPEFAAQQMPNDLHYKPAGSAILAKAVAESIEAQLPKAGK